MKSLRIALLALMSLLVITLVGCDALHEAPSGALPEKEAQLGVLAYYVPTMPLQASYASSTLGAPTWNRLTPDGELSGIGTAVPYQVQAFEVSAEGTYHIHSLQEEYDGYLHLYGGSFDPASPFTGFIAANDDNGPIGESLVVAYLVPGATYYVVTNGFLNSDYGPFTNSIYGLAAVTLLGDEDPIEATNSLIDDVEQLVEEGVLKAGQANGLIRPLENALRSLEKDHTLDACNQLGDFIVEVEAKVPPLTADQADDLIASAQAIRSTLDCE